MKLARVIPLFKNCDMNDFTNYRPISLVSQFSKILENIFHNRMMLFIDDKHMGLGKYVHITGNIGACYIGEITTSIDDKRDSKICGSAAIL